MYLYEIIKLLEYWYKEADKICKELYDELIKNGIEKEKAEQIVQNTLNIAFNKTWRF